MPNNSRRTLGISLLEVLVAATLLSIGFVATFKCLGAMAASQGRTLDEETMQRLALQTYDQLIVQQTFTSGQQDGDFMDRGEPRFIWHAERAPSGSGNLDILRVEVGRRSDNYVHAQKLQGLISRPKGSGS